MTSTGRPATSVPSSRMPLPVASSLGISDYEVWGGGGDFTVHGTGQGAWGYERRTRKIQHLQDPAPVNPPGVGLGGTPGLSASGTSRALARLAPGP
jgi:hypothetical protein